MNGRFFVHFAPFDETFDPHKLAAAYGTGLLDREGEPIATTPQVLGYVSDPCVAAIPPTRSMSPPSACRL